MTDNIDWKSIRKAVALRISLLEFTCKKALDGDHPLNQKIFDDLIRPNLKLLASFCEAVTIDRHDDAVCRWTGIGTCPVCGNEVGRIL